MEGASVPQYSRALQLFRADNQDLLHAGRKNSPPPSPRICRCKSPPALTRCRSSTATAATSPRLEFPEASGRWMRDIIAAHPLLRRRPESSPRPSSFSRSAPTATGPTSSPPARTSSAIDWQTSLAGSAENHSGAPRHAGKPLARRCWRKPRRKWSRRKPARCWKPCAAVPDTSSTSATA